MSTTPTYPGIYIEEIPSAVRSITAVGTSTTAFIGRAIKGPVDEPTIINSFSEYDSIFGGLWNKSSMSYAVYQFFLNGGNEAVIVRVHKSAVNAVFENTIPLFIASNPGEWANSLAVTIDSSVDKNAVNTANLFNIIVREIIGRDQQGNPNKFIERESFRNVSIDKNDTRYYPTVLEESSLIRVNNDALLPSTIPKTGDYVVVSTSGSNGSNITSIEIIGKSDATTGEKTGMYALDNADIFNLLCIPPPNPDSTQDEPGYYDTICANALAYCKSRRAMLIVDPPMGWRTTLPTLETIGDDVPLQGDGENAMIYFPRIMAPDPLSEGRVKSFPPCGVVAGIISKTDSQRGVWKAPAGIETSLSGVQGLEVLLTNDENGRLNPIGVNCLRFMSPAGRVVWGARTMRGADMLADQWKYIPVRRTALFIEESLYRGTQWVVFEPNDEPLWAQIRLNVGAFMHDLFRKGAFQGSTPKEAYLVKCDKETTTQTDIDRGIVNIVVGFAPLKPAEFVIIKIQQLAGQMESQ